jgi:thioredoxin-like negative regulator of GroEL
VAVSSPPAEAPVRVTAERLRLILFHSSIDGRCRRTEGFLAQVLQRRRNHNTFEILRVDVTRRPELAERLGVDEVPTLLVVAGKKVRRRIVAPNGCRGLEAELAPWLR